MKKLTFFTIVYSALVLLGGATSFFHESRLTSILFEVPVGALLLISIVFLMEKSTKISILIVCLTFLLVIYYGYNFFLHYSFFSGVMTIASSFLTFSYAIDILKRYT